MRNKFLFITFVTLIFCFLYGCTQEKEIVSSETSEQSISEQSIIETENYDTILGTWTVNGIYYDGELIEFTDSKTNALAQMYDSTVLSVSENGEFWLYNIMFYEGECLKLSEKSFILNIKYSYNLEYIEDKLYKTEGKSIKDKAYLVTVNENNSLKISEFDLETGQSIDEMPLLLCRK